jgi:arsenate reductase (thioredoxin)
MAEVGIDISTEHPKPWTDQRLQAADVIITMGCGDTCPYYPAKRYDDWDLDDPAGQSIDAVRPIRDDIADRVRNLLLDLDITPTEPLTSHESHRPAPSPAADSEHLPTALN